MSSPDYNGSNRSGPNSTNTTAGPGRGIWSAIGIGLLFRLAAYAAFVFGFWLLYQAFESGSVWPSVGLGLAGGVTVLAATYLMVGFRRRARS